ncbi:uncharacterized protein TNCV_1340361 [Trichonephila clavipes]|nr:uncharacterized protein TNCV_1340361 [Trichonephila clavipes]
MAEGYQRETAFHRQTCLGGEQSHDNSHIAFQCYPAEDYWLSQHVLISTITEMCHYCKTLKFKGETKGMLCTTGKIKLPQLGEPPEPLKTLLARYNAELHFLYH